MKTYELIIEQRQPPCGGKSPVDVKISTVTTDDPLAYVKNIEKDGEPRMETTDQVEIVSRLECGANSIKVTFTEE